MSEGDAAAALVCVESEEAFEVTGGVGDGAFEMRLSKSSAELEVATFTLRALARANLHPR